MLRKRICVGLKGAAAEARQLLLRSTIAEEPVHAFSQRIDYTQ